MEHYHEEYIPLKFIKTLPAKRAFPQPKLHTHFIPEANDPGESFQEPHS